MGTTTMGVKLDDATRERIKSAATRIDRTPHWLIKQAIFSYIAPVGFPRRDHRCLSPPGNRSGFYVAGTSSPAAADC